MQQIGGIPYDMRMQGDDYINFAEMSYDENSCRYIIICRVTLYGIVAEHGARSTKRGIGTERNSTLLYLSSKLFREIVCVRARLLPHDVSTYFDAVYSPPRIYKCGELPILRVALFNLEDKFVRFNTSESL